jgi:CheY-like chemotaxis protein
MIMAVVNEILSKEMIEETAEMEQRDCLVLGEEDALLAAIQEETPEVLFLEIGLSSLDGAALIEKLKQNPSTRQIPIVAFGNSLRADLLQDAKELGADLVLPKAAFREQLLGLIRHYSKSTQG